MKWLVLILMVLSLGTIYLLIASRSPSVSLKSAEIKYPPLLILGEQKINNVTSARFSISNTGDLPLILDRIHTSCSCAGVFMDDTSNDPIHQLSIEPHTTTNLRADITVKGYAGLGETVKIYFNTNSIEHPVCEIAINIPRILGIACVPSAIHFNDAVCGESHSKRVRSLPCPKSRRFEGLFVGGNRQVPNWY